MRIQMHSPDLAVQVAAVDDGTLWVELAVRQISLITTSFNTRCRRSRWTEPMRSMCGCTDSRSATRERSVTWSLSRRRYVGAVNP